MTLYIRRADLAQSSDLSGSVHAKLDDSPLMGAIQLKQSQRKPISLLKFPRVDKLLKQRPTTEAVISLQEVFRWTRLLRPPKPRIVFG
jgi:hypothetical protein